MAFTPPPHVQVLHIGHPRIEPSEDKVRLIADIRIGTDDCRPLWVEFDKEYAQYLCDERSDAFLIGLLLYAMFNRLDIVCEAPVTAQLLYQLRTYLIPALAHNSAVLHETQISASLAEAPMPNAGGVGASCSCGVDSLYSIKNNMASPYPGQSITHLCVNNTGHMNTREQYLWLLDHAKAFAKEYGFKLIISDSNIARDFRLNVRHMNTYPTSFVVYALQKLWSIYYLASDGYGLAEFSVKNLEDVFDAHHELLSLDSFSTRGLQFYSDGAPLTRYEKIKDLLDWEPAQKFLHVCVAERGPNCGRCSKCLRTLTLLDAQGGLDRFRGVFDVDDYLRRRKTNLRWLYQEQLLPNGDTMTKPAYAVLKGEITLPMRLYVWAKLFYYCVKGVAKRLLKKA